MATSWDKIFFVERSLLESYLIKFLLEHKFAQMEVKNGKTNSRQR